MKFRNFEALMEFDEEAEIFHGEVSNIQDVITFQGRSVAELENAFKDSVEDYLEFLHGINESKLASDQSIVIL